MKTASLVVYSLLSALATDYPHDEACFIASMEIIEGRLFDDAIQPIAHPGDDHWVECEAVEEPERFEVIEIDYPQVRR